jgi:hypothetical protein
MCVAKDRDNLRKTHDARCAVEASGRSTERREKIFGDGESGEVMG